MKIWFTSGDPYEDSDKDYTPAEAAGIARDWPWAALDRGDLVVGNYRERTSIADTAITGRKMAAQLARRA